MSFSKQKGFTLIELIVVIALMAVIATLFLANYNGLRGPRNLKLAQNQMTTNIRKIQSYTLSARNVTVGGTVAAKYYVVQASANSNQYTIQTIDTNYVLNSAQETVSLPNGISISSIQYVTPDNVTNTASSIQVAYAAPYAKVLTYTPTDCSSSSFLTALQDAACVLNLSDRKTIFTLRDSVSATTKTVTIYGISGKVEAGP